MTAKGSMILDAFELTLCDIASVELDALHAFSIGVRWPHRAEDWQFLRKLGRGVAARDEIGRLAGTAMWFPYERDFATVGMVITSPRLQTQGTGLWMMEHIRGEAGERMLGLNATRAARRLYLSMGFSPEATLFQRQGEALCPPAAPLPAGASLRGILPTDLPEIAALDALAFGAGRAKLLAGLSEVSRGIVLEREGRIAAFSLCRRFGRGHVIGPVVAASDADAIAVVRSHVADHAGRFLRLDTRLREGAFAAFLSACGLPVFDMVTTMSLGRRWLPRPDAPGPAIFAVAAQALG